MDAYQIAQKYRMKITSGELAHGARLKSVRDLGAEEGVSAQTASMAYNLLSVYGLVRTDNKSGTYVVGSKTAALHVGSFNSAPDWNRKPWRAHDENDVEDATLYEVRVSHASERLVEWGLEEGTRIAERHTVKTLNGVAVQHKVSILPYDLAVTMPRDADYEGLPPMMTPVGHPLVEPPAGMSMMAWLGWDVDRASTTIKVDPMSVDAAAVFDVHPETPGLTAFTTVVDTRGRVLYIVIGTSRITNEYTVDYKL